MPESKEQRNETNQAKGNKSHQPLLHRGIPLLNYPKLLCHHGFNPDLLVRGDYLHSIFKRPAPEALLQEDLTNFLNLTLRIMLPLPLFPPPLILNEFIAGFRAEVISNCH